MLGRLTAILLGALLVLAGLAVGMLVAPYSNTALKIIGDVPEDRLAFFTLLLAVFTMVLAVATVALAVASIDPFI